MVDDEPTIASILARGLQHSGYRVAVANSGEEALEIMAEKRFDAMVTDLHMPKMRGDELLQRAQELDHHMVVILVTAAGDLQCAVRCLHQGAADYISKPFDLGDVAARLEKALERRELTLEQERLTAENHNYQLNLQQLVEEQAGQLRSMFQNSLQTLNYALEAKDESTRNHSHRVALVAEALAAKLPGFDRPAVERLRLAAEFHDIGKIGVPEAILSKAEPLTEDEYLQVKRHPEIGESILRPLFNDSELLAIVRGHHEQWSGAGYPDGLCGEDIAIGARIVAVSDAYDAMTSARPYREGMSQKQALGILYQGRWHQWDGNVVQALLDMAHSGELLEVTQKASTWVPGLTIVEGTAVDPTPYFGSVRAA